MGGPLRRPTKFDCGAALQQSSNLFYQKFVEINSVGGCGEEKGFKGKRNRRSRRSLSASGGHSLAPLCGARFPQNFSRRK